MRQYLALKAQVPRRAPVLPHGRLLRAVPRGRGARRAAPRHRAHHARQGQARRRADVRRAGPRGRRLRPKRSPSSATASRSASRSRMRARRAAAARAPRRGRGDDAGPGRRSRGPRRARASSSLVALALDGADEVGLAALDASTGSFRATRVSRVGRRALPRALLDELERIAPRELLLAGGRRRGRCASAAPRAAPGARDRCAAAPRASSPRPRAARPDGFDRVRERSAELRAAAAVLALPRAATSRPRSARRRACAATSSPKR